jgi:hypothetical protein
VVPRLSPGLKLLEQDFLSVPAPTRPFTESYWLGSRNTINETVVNGKQNDGYDYVVTLFFIDTSLNAIATIEHIYALLKPGGTWINLGPLLWTGGAQASVELSLEEVINLAEEVGFIVEVANEKSGGDEDFDECLPAGWEGVDMLGRRTVECEYTSDGMAMMRWIYAAEFWVARKSK